MALFSSRLRRALSLSSSLISRQKQLADISSTVSPFTLSSITVGPKNPTLKFGQSNIPSLSRHFRSSSVSLQSARSSFRSNTGDNEEITEDTILFEGCDYNHWLITMDFPKDRELAREEKIETYLQTLAKVVGSYEEAKKRMYAFSTTTYQGFQCLVTEEMSEKFKGLPGVVFVLPDSYIDPVNKEYGGDKYDNGVITPRPPPFEYGRNRGRSGDRNRDYNRRQGGPIRSQQDNTAYGNQGSTDWDTRNSRQLGDYNMHQMQGGGRDHSPLSNAANGREPMPPFQPNYGQGDRGYSNPQGGGLPSGDQRNYAPPQGGNYGQPADRNYGHVAGGDYRPPRGGNYGPQAGGNYGHGEAGNYGHGAGRNYGQQAGGNYGQQAGGNYGQPAGLRYGQPASGYYGQPAAGNHGQPGGGNYGHAVGGNYQQGFHAVQGHQAGYGPSSFVQNDPAQKEEQFSRVDERGNMQGEQRNYTPMAQSGADQGRY